MHLRWLHPKGIALSTFLGPDGRVGDSYWVGLKTTGVPVSVFITRDGCVSGYVPSPLDAALIDARLKAVL